MKTQLTFLVLFVLMTAGFGHRAPAPAPSPQPSPTALPTPSAPYHGPKIIALGCDSTCSADQLAQVPLIEAAMNQTLTSDCLAQYFRTPGRRLDNTNGLTPDQILAKLHIPTALTINYFYKGWPSRTQGYESADDFSTIHFNSRYTNSWSVCEIASLGLHEFTHTKQFWHNGNKAAPNYYTIPYTMNHAADSKTVDARNGGCCL